MDDGRIEPRGAVGENILDWKIVRRVDSSTGEAPVFGEGLYPVTDNPSTNAYNRNSLANPAFYGAPFRLRLGLDYDF